MDVEQSVEAITTCTRPLGLFSASRALNDQVRRLYERDRRANKDPADDPHATGPPLGADERAGIRSNATEPTPVPAPGSTIEQAKA